MQEIITLDLDGVNAYLIKENGCYLLVDTGGPMMLDRPYTNRREVLVQKLKEHGCEKGNLKLILLTHGDCDHCANAAYLAKEYGALIGMNQEDLCQVTNLTPEIYLKSCQFRSLGMKIMFVLLHKLILSVAKVTAERFESFQPNILLGDHDSLIEYGFSAEIVSLPGHTPGSIGIYTKDKELICGDLYQGTKKPKLADNAWDFVQLEMSRKKLKTYEIHKIYPGHGTPFSASMMP